MKLHVKGLVAKPTAAGIRYYWQPNAIERRAKWNGFPCGPDLSVAVKMAEERNAEIVRWRDGGARPRAVRAYTAPRTFGMLIDRYLRERLPKLAANTQRVNRSALRRLDQWAGNQPLAFITRQRVRVLITAMLDPRVGIGHSPAFKTVKMGRELWSWGETQELVPTGINPFVRQDITAPPPRDQIWEPEDFPLAQEAAQLLGLDGIALAILLAADIGQRESDLLALTSGRWQELRGIDADDASVLANRDGPDAGKVMGFNVRQNKTREWVGVPVVGETRRAVESAIARNADRRATGVAVVNIITNSRTGLPYQQRQFIRDFAAVLAKMRELAAQRDAEQARRLATIQFRDLRRTCAVRLGELGLEDQLIAGVTGHKLESIKKILEVYMPRTTKMAARAMVAKVLRAREIEPEPENFGIQT